MVRVGPMWNHVRHIHIRTSSLWSYGDVSSGDTGISILHHVVERAYLGSSCLPVHSFSRESNDDKSSKQYCK